MSEEIQWDKNGLVPVIVQDRGSGKVMMLAWMNQAALEATVKTRQAVYWSRSRQQLWRKGETSGNTQSVCDIYLDCDGDALLLVVEQHGKGACHTGNFSCFFRSYKNREWKKIS